MFDPDGRLIEEMIGTLKKGNRHQINPGKELTKEGQDF